LALSDRLTLAQGGPRALTPQDKLEARQVALSCTQNMLMALTREERLIYVLDTVFDLPSAVAAEVVGVAAATYRQRLSRSRARLAAFTGGQCGLVSDSAACKCERQLPALRQLRQQEQRGARAVVPIQVEDRQAEREFDAFLRVSDAAALFRAHPEAAAPSGMLAAIRAVLTQEGFLKRGLPQ
jgi:cytochrome P450